MGFFGLVPSRTNKDNATASGTEAWYHSVAHTVDGFWTWQGGANRLTAFTASNGVTTTLDYDGAGRITRRYTAQGYSDYTYEDGTDWLVRETWHAATSGNVFDLVRYWYTKGRPSRVEVASVSGDLQMQCVSKVTRPLLLVGFVF